MQYLILTYLILNLISPLVYGKFPHQIPAADKFLSLIPLATCFHCFAVENMQLQT